MHTLSRDKIACKKLLFCLPIKESSSGDLLGRRLQRFIYMVLIERKPLVSLRSYVRIFYSLAWSLDNKLK